MNIIAIILFSYQLAYQTSFIAMFPLKLSLFVLFGLILGQGWIVKSLKFPSILGQASRIKSKQLKLQSTELPEPNIRIGEYLIDLNYLKIIIIY